MAGGVGGRVSPRRAGEAPPELDVNLGALDDPPRWSGRADALVALGPLALWFGALTAGAWCAGGPWWLVLGFGLVGAAWLAWAVAELRGSR